jgi:hypothetical protein
MLQAFPREFDMAAALCRVTSGADLHRLRSDLDDLVFDVRVQARVQRVHSRRELEGFDEGLGDWMVILNHHCLALSVRSKCASVRRSIPLVASVATRTATSG